MDITGVSLYGTYSSTLTLCGSKCRWCGEQDGSPEQDPYARKCNKCGALFDPIADVGCDNHGSVKVYLNPDNSMFIELCYPGNMYARFALDTAVMMKTGLLNFFDEPQNGRK